MSRPYRGSSEYSLMWIVIGFMGIGCGLAAGSMLPRNVPWWWAAAAIMSPIVGAFVLCAWLTVRRRRRRWSEIKVDLERGDFITDVRPDAERKQAVLAAVADLQRRLNLRNGADGIEWIALHTREPSAMCIFEHAYVTGSGKTTQVHLHTVMAWLTPHATGGDVSAYRPQRLQRRSLTRGGGLVKVGDAEFDRRWVVLGDEAGARKFLSDEVRALLADSPRGESWHTSANWLACAYAGTLDARNLAKFRRRCAEIAARAGGRR